MLALLLSLTAHAADLPEPTVTIQDDGTIVGTVHLAVPRQRLQKELADPVWLTRIDGGGTQVKVEGKQGECVLISSVSPSKIMTARYKTTQCPTANGYTTTLRDSNCFKTYGSEWRLADGPSGAIGTYTINLSTSLWVPNSVVRSKTKGHIERMLNNLQDWSKRQD